MEKVASVIKYRDREDLIHWLNGFPTRYTREELNSIFSRVKMGKWIVWTLEQGLFIY